MSLNIGFFFNIKNKNHLDFRDCLSGNPGIGGAGYAMLTVGTMLANTDGFQVSFYTLEKQSLHEAIIQKCVKDELEAIRMAKRDHVDVFIFNANLFSKEFYAALDREQLASVAWFHNYNNCKIIKAVRECAAIKRVVFVSQQHYDAYIDDPIINKAVFIYLTVPKRENFCRSLGKEKIVTYVGGLYKAKGFHILAKYWKYIASQVPDAVLYVIGSGKLYSESILGKLGIAAPDYEKKLMKYLQDRDGKLVDSVKFMGILGGEKEEIYEKTYVGIANPSGFTETFCLSAVEFEAHGIPVVTYKGYGLLDTVICGETGLTSKWGKKQADYIIRLLKDEKENRELGQGAQQYVKRCFAPEIVLKKWVELIHDVTDNREVKSTFSGKHMSDDWKWLKYLNYNLHRILHLRSGISVCYAVSWIKLYVKKILKYKYI